MHIYLSVGHLGHPCGIYSNTLFELQAVDHSCCALHRFEAVAFSVWKTDVCYPVLRDYNCIYIGNQLSSSRVL